MFTGNPNLNNAWYHSANLNYFNFSMFNFTNINAGLSYQKRYQSIGANVNFQGLERISSPINIDQANENLSAFGNYERRLSLLKGKI